MVTEAESLQSWRLAMLAAQPRFIGRPPEGAVAEARELWRQAGLPDDSADYLTPGAGDLPVYEKVCEAADAESAEIEICFGPVKKPQRFPATGVDFIRLAIPGRSEARTKRMKDYLAAWSDDSAPPEFRLASFKAQKLSETEWGKWAERFRNWWFREIDRRKQVQTSVAGKASVESRKLKKAE